MIEGNIFVFFVCCICGRGMAIADYIDFETSLEYCKAHNPQVIYLPPQSNGGESH